MAEWRWVGLGLGCAMVLAGCGGEEPEGGSGVSVVEAGSGGGGAGGSLSLGVLGGGGAGGAAGSGVGGGGASTNAGTAGVPLHTCPAAAEPSCPAKVIVGTATADDDELTALQGVTHVQGDLLVGSPLALDSLSCLETVDGKLTLDFFADEREGTLWGLRNLRKVGERIELNPDERLHVDCGFSRLLSVGEELLTGGALDVTGPLAGHLDLSTLKVGQHFRVRDSELVKVTLPSNTTLTRGQLGFQGNSMLSEIAGFAGNTLTNSGTTVGGAYSVMITNNPLLSECRARELAQLLLDAGAPADSVTIMGNLACP